MKVSGDSGLAEQQQRQLESDPVEPLPECLGTLRMKAVSDPFRESSLVFGSSMPAAPEQTHGVCGPGTPADVGVEAARWAIPASQEINIADEDSSEEVIGEEILEGRREGANTQDLGGLFTQVGAVRRRAFGCVFSIRIWRGASQAQDVPRCSSAVWSWVCLVVLLCGLSCRSMLSEGQSASAGRIVEAHRTHFLRRPWSLPGQPRQNLDGAGGACLGGLGIGRSWSHSSAKPPRQRPTTRWLLT